MNPSATNGLPPISNDYYFPDLFNTSDLYQIASQYDLTKIIPQLLEQLIVLGELAQQLSRVLGKNGERSESLLALLQQLIKDRR